jgi:hypothetical protein
MPLTDYELDHLEEAAYMCDGDMSDIFGRRLLPQLATLSEGELWALAGKFLGRDMDQHARFVADYAHAVRRAEMVKQPRPDPVEFWRHGESKEVARAFAKRQETELARFGESEEIPF